MKSGFETAFFISALMRFTTAFGTPAGPSNPNQVVLVKPGSVSAIAGTSGHPLTRFGVDAVVRAADDAGLFVVGVKVP